MGKKAKNGSILYAGNQWIAAADERTQVIMDTSSVFR